MSAIQQRSVSAVALKRVLLSNSQDARVLPFESSWTSLRIGLRLHMRNQGANLTGTPRLAFGVIAGTSNLFDDLTTSHFVGIRTNAATWTYTGTNRFLVPVGSLVPIKKVGVTVTSGTAFFPATQWGIGAATAVTGEVNGTTTASADRTLLFVDITKGTPNFTIKCFGWQNTGAAPADVDFETFETLMSSGAPSLSEHASSDEQSLAVDQTANGTLNAVTWHWSRLFPHIVIEDIALKRLS